MKTPLKVAEIPLHQLWRDSAWIKAERERYLTPEETTRLIGDPVVAIAVASIADPLRWPDRDQRFKEWNAIKTLLIDGTASTWTSQHDEFYVASLWGPEPRLVVLFEHHH